MRKRSLWPAVKVPLPQSVQKTSEVYPPVLLHAPAHPRLVPTPRCAAVLASQEKPRELSRVPGMGLSAQPCKTYPFSPHGRGPCLLHPPHPPPPSQDHRARFVGMPSRGPTFARFPSPFPWPWDVSNMMSLF